MKQRNHAYNSKITWARMITFYGQNCAYCMEEPAQSIDHVIPWSYSQDNSIENLRPCCLWCNLHAGDKMFSSFEQKRAYLKDKRGKGRSAASRTVCTTCLLPYQRPHMTTSMFECPICDPSKSRGSQHKEWKNFLPVLRQAGIRLDLHAKIRDMTSDGMNLTRAKKELGELYIVAILGDQDGDFALEDLSFWGVTGA